MKWCYYVLLWVGLISLHSCEHIPLRGNFEGGIATENYKFLFNNDGIFVAYSKVSKGIYNVYQGYYQNAKYTRRSSLINCFFEKHYAVAYNDSTGEYEFDPLFVESSSLTQEFVIIREDYFRIYDGTKQCVFIQERNDVDLGILKAVGVR